MRLYVASAGTGKTETLMGELKALLEGGVPLRRVAAVSFTRKSAEELRFRVRRLLEAHREAFWAREALREVHGALFTTLHGFMAEALRHTAPFLGLDPDFRVMDGFLAQALFLEEARSLLFLEGHPEAPELLKLLEALYEKRSLAEAFTPLPGAEGLLALYERVLARYRARTQEVLGPGDLEAKALLLLRHPEALGRVAERFSHLLVDEFQDVNPLQGRFLRALEEAGVRVVAVGDPKQSIYLFRNARVEVFLRARAAAEEVRALSRTHRHAKQVVELLNRFTARFFRAEEGNRVEGVREAEGRVEVHWVLGKLEEARRAEARLLAQRLLALRAEGIPFGEMAVLVRARTSLPPLEKALRAAGVPFVRGRGQSFFARPEVRDLYHALRLALAERPYALEDRLSLLAFLRSPFLGLDLSELEEALRAEDPWPLLPKGVQGALEGLRALALLPPLEALRRLARDEGFLRRISRRARANLDTLLLLAAGARFPTLEDLLLWLALRAKDPESVELPEGGGGVTLLTVHGAKGLEWPVVALYDVSRGPSERPPPLLVDEEGRVALKGTEAYRALLREAERAEREEALRLLYVALSRARDLLLITGSTSQRPGPWAEALQALGLGPDAQDPWVETHPLEAIPPLPPIPQAPQDPRPAPYTPWRGEPRARPPVYSPSAHLKAEAEPLEVLGEGEALPEWARAVGTLVHYAIARHLDPEDEGAMGGLLRQEVALAFGEGEREALLEEVRALLRAYRSLLSGALPPLEARAEDHAELPLLLPHKGTVWYGVLDRLYRVGDRWYLDDYKTDQKVRPEAYRFQLALYRKAVLEAWGVEAEARLVYLRHRQVVPLSPAELEAALEGL
ncbi:UvrD-helicase domain-containing protein [Thermus oshimai]|jgi:ATP-dependent helicase/nuclease subunit A|uniref:UvrD-helicase domain-containing protein n=1 Tax=Thermus oshimai TaxID=56957 RepID=UPI0031FB5AC1